jgi:hypothetical protein
VRTAWVNTRGFRYRYELVTACKASLVARRQAEIALMGH